MLLFILSLGCLGLSLSTGAVKISITEMVQFLIFPAGPAHKSAVNQCPAHKAGADKAAKDIGPADKAGADENLFNKERINKEIFIKIRLPRVLSAFFSGALLGLCGLIFQCLLQNPLADPYVLGISAGSALGAVTAMSLGMMSIAAVSGAAFAGGLATVAVVVIAGAKSFRSDTLITAGIMINASLSSVVSLMVYLSPRVKSVMFWLMGSFSSSLESQALAVGILAFLLVLLVWALGPWMDALSLGEVTAASLGVPVKKLRITLFACASAATAMVVSFFGIIGFAGLMVPHVTRALIKSGHRRMSIPAFLIGASFMCLCDTLARTAAAPEQLPVGIITGLLGGPFFIYILMKKSSM
jgi:iron complex transport system permease protein